ncbi:MAG: ABC transporter permease [Lachnospiraceae bacterium]|nr:ABC transporter permease [Lachnospiraceae bacterium]
MKIAAEGQEQNKKVSVWKKIRSMKEFSVLAILLALIVFISVMSPAFLTVTNLRTTAIGFSCNAIIAIAMTLALVSGGFDLAVGSVLGLSAVSVVVMTNSGVSIWLACIAGILVGILCGAINGLLIGYLNLNAFITTLGMQQMARGIVYVLTNGGSIGLQDAAGVEAFRYVGSGSIGSIPVLVIVCLVLVIIGDILVRRSGAARNVFFVGSNEKTAMLSGIDTKMVKTMVYVLTGALSGLAGVLTASRFGTATSSTGSGVEMTVISAAVIGGVSLSGGKGTVAGAVLGVVMMSVISNILVILNVSVHWQNFITGAILILAIIFDVLSNRKKN